MYIRAVSDPTKPQGVSPSREPPSWRRWALGLAAVLLAVIVLQNAQEVRVEILFAEFNAPLILVLLIAAALGAVIGWAAPVLRRHHREERRR
jgi:MYXO-CTERM domain-containing protein